MRRYSTISTMPPFPVGGIAVIVFMWAVSISFKLIDVNYRSKGPDIERHGDDAFCIFALRNIDLLLWQDSETFMNSTYEKIMMCDLRNEPLLLLLRLNLVHIQVVKEHLGVIKHIAWREELQISGLKSIVVSLAKIVYAAAAMPFLLMEFVSLVFVSASLSLMDYAIFID